MRIVQEHPFLVIESTGDNIDDFALNIEDSELDSDEERMESRPNETK